MYSNCLLFKLFILSFLFKYFFHIILTKLILFKDLHHCVHPSCTYRMGGSQVLLNKAQCTMLL